MVTKGKKLKATNFAKELRAKIKKGNKKPRLKYIIIPLVLILTLILIAGAKYYPVARSLYGEARRGKESLLLAQDYVKKEDFSKAHELLQEANKSFSLSQEHLRKFAFLKYIPIASQQYIALEVILSSGLEVTSGLEDLMGLALEVLEPLKKDSKINLALISTKQKNEILKKIHESDDLFFSVKGKVDSASLEVGKLSEKGLIGPIKEALVLMKENLPALKSGINQASSLTRILPQVAGYPEGKTYLFLLENNTELRPTGGFIGTYGILKVKDSEITSFTTDNVYNLDEQAVNLEVEPPWPLTRYNKVYKWYLRDSNWSPDFPTSAEKALWFYKEEGGPERGVDGVIAITPTFIESLISLTGSINVHGVEFTSDNFVDTLQYQVEKGFYQAGLEESQRKEIIGDLSKVLIDKIFALPQEKWKSFFEILQNDFKEKHLLLYLKDDVTQNLILENNWGGKIRPSPSDYFTLIDANLASLKSDPGVKRTLNYHLKEEDNKLIANLQIVYKNEGAFTWKTTRYRTFFRLYVPQGSKLIDIMGTNEDKETINELGKTYFGSFISVEPQETKKIMFTYELPDYVYKSLKEKKYYLLVQKQAGAQNYDFNLFFDFKGKIKDFSPIDKGKEESDNNLSFKTSLNQDLEFYINLK